MGDIGYIFSGLGAQWLGMGQDLLTKNVKFREAFREFDRALASKVGWSVEEGLGDTGRDLKEATFWHPAIMAMEWGLYKALEGLAPVPDVVIGHSGGEVMAALVSGAISLEQAAFLVSEQIRLMAKAPAGGLLHLAMGLARARELASDYSLTITAHNAPSSFVVTGSEGDLAALSAREDLKPLIRRVSADRPFHCSSFAPFVDEFAERLAPLQPQAAAVTFLSAKDGRVLPGEALGAPYWRDHVVEPVRFDLAGSLALDLGLRVVLDFSPHPILLEALAEMAAGKNLDVATFPMAQRGADSQTLWAEALKALGDRAATKKKGHVAGVARPAGSKGKAAAEGDEYEGLIDLGIFEQTKAALATLPPEMARAQLARLIVDMALALIEEEGHGTDNGTGHGPGNGTGHGAGNGTGHGPGNGKDGGAGHGAGGGLAKSEVADKADLVGRPFMSLGLGSLGLIRMIAELSQKTGLKLSSSLVFSYPEASGLANYLYDRFFGSEAKGNGRDKKRVLSSQRLGEPLAFVGASVRFPGGVNDLDGYWDLLSRGVDAVGAIPRSRWEAERYYHPDREHPGTMYTMEAGFIEDTFRGFDADFFGLAGREAKQLDPQQRLLLEMSWEAFENGAINPAEWRDGRVGVFLGMTNNEYARAHRDSYRRELIDAYSLTGTTMSGACGRISYFFGFRGPCLCVDTACSSAMAALSRAAQSLRLGECDLALVGAVTLMLIPDMHICFTKLGAISPDGRCKTFDDGADGYGRGEGGAVVLLKRLSDAQADGDLIMGLLLGQALNQDGRSNGLTAPSGLAQRELIEETLALSGLSPADVDYVEAHGTGTALGDSVELLALSQAYGPGRVQPLALGSVKANIGHLEPAAALASLLKILVCFREGFIPANIHLKTPNKHFDWNTGRLLAPTSPILWKTPPGRPKRAGFSAFGFSGVNGHAIVEEYIPPAPVAVNVVAGAEATVAGANVNDVTVAVVPDWKLPPLPLFLSAKSPGALRELARRVAERLAGASHQEAASLCLSLALHRPHFDYRLALVGSKPSDLTAIANREPAKTSGVPKIGLLFTGQGAQRPGVGLELSGHYQALKDSLERSAAILAPLGLDLITVLDPAWTPEETAETSVSQPLIVAVSLALLDLWTSLGLSFDSVLGHSVGEFPAMVAAGFLSARQALELVIQRGRLMGAAPGQGGMMAVFLSAGEMGDVLKDFPSLSLAADNAPSSVTVAGPNAGLSKLGAFLEAQKIPYAPLRVSKAFHTAHMAEAAEGVALAAERILGKAVAAPATGAFPTLISTATAESLSEITPSYFRDQINGPVVFRTASQRMAKRVQVALEAGPGAALSGLARESAGLKAFPSLKAGQGELKSFLSAAAGLYLAGINLNYKALFAPLPGKRVSLPLYPFQREEYWMEVVTDPPIETRPKTSGQGLDGASPTFGGQASPAFGDEASPLLGHRPISPAFGDEASPLLGNRLISPAFGEAVVFEKRFTEKSPYFLSEHILFDLAVSPATGHLAMVLAAVKAIRGSPLCEISEVTFERPLTLAKGQERLVQVIVDQPQAKTSPFRLISRLSTSQSFTDHARGTVTFGPPDGKGLEGQKLPLGPPRKITGEDFYNRFIKNGYNLGPSFTRIRDIELYAIPNEADLIVTQVEGLASEPQYAPGQTRLASQASPASQANPASFEGEVIYPGTLDSILQSVMPPLIDGAEILMASSEKLFVPFYLGSLKILGDIPNRLTCQARGELSPLGHINGLVKAYDQTGRPILAFEDLTFKESPFSSQEAYESLEDQDDPKSFGDLFYVEKWLEASDLPSKASQPQGTDSSSPFDKRPRLRIIHLGQGEVPLGKTSPDEIVFSLSPDGALGEASPSEIVLTLSPQGVLDERARDGTLEALPPDGTLTLEEFTRDGTLGDLPELAGSLFMEALEALKWAIASPVPKRIHLITFGARKVFDSDQIAPIGSALLGLARTLALENPGHLGMILDLPLYGQSGSGPERSIRSGKDFSLALDMIDDYLTSGKTEPIELALREGRRYRPEIARLPLAKTASLKDRSEGFQLIAGANGALAKHLARHLAQGSATRLAFLSRQKKEFSQVPPDPEKTALLTELKALGTRVVELRADVTDLEALREALSRLREEGPIKGVWHLVGRLSDALITDLDQDKVTKVFGPKVQGAINLHLATLEDPLEEFTVFSSAAALLGSGGQANYTAANLILEALINGRRGQDLPGAALAWGPWAQGGMAEGPGRERNLKSMGFTPLKPRVALTALEAALANGEAVTAIARVNWAKMAEKPERCLDTRLMALFSDLPGTGPRVNPQSQSGDNQSALSPITLALEEGLRWMAQTGDIEPLTQALTALAADLLGFPPERIERHKPLNDYGFDSLMVVSLRNHLSRALGRNVPVTLAFEHPSVAAIADWLYENQPAEPAVSPGPACPETISLTSPDANGFETEEDPESSDTADLAQNLIEYIDRLLDDI
ncbi:MAG: acyltransferase domain-containing protein [Deltaproteobacteria bacterium]|jgi:acyl transferase domain-containing protein/acyl carrier protein|nr:acyltransferase domain-containing protein [Deltaproteobacteria bacterium]